MDSTPVRFSRPRSFHCAEITYYVSGSNEPVSECFDSEAHFDRVMGRDLYVETEDGTKRRRVASLKQALDINNKVGTRRLVLHVPFTELSKDVSKLNGYVHNEASSLEVTTTLAIARDETFAKEYGKLELINEGHGVVFFRATDKDKEKEKPAFEVDGLVKNSTVLLMNETKRRLDKDDAPKILKTAQDLQDAITYPNEYTTKPVHVLSEIQGLSKVVAIASTNGCKPGAKEKCAELGIHLVTPDGSGFAATLHKLPPTS
jgi:hypothetical protein